MIKNVYFDPTHIASASIAQVHELKGDVVKKVLKPGIEDTMVWQILILFELLLRYGSF